jgi:hypothetical protein
MKWSLQRALTEVQLAPMTNQIAVFDSHPTATQFIRARAATMVCGHDVLMFVLHWTEFKI